MHWVRIAFAIDAGVLMYPRCFEASGVVRDKINIRRGLARIAHDQAEHQTLLVQVGLECCRITRLVIFGIDFVSMISGNRILF
jgi:hypothetical protein